MRGLRAGLVPAAVALAVAGCVPAPAGTGLSFGFARGWQGPLPTAPRLLDDARWWQGLQDPALDALIARALADSPDLAAARARHAAARAMAAAVPGALTVSGGVGAGVRAGNLRSADAGAAGDGALELLFDPGGGRAAERRGAAAALDLAAAEAAGARLFLIGEVAETYLSLRHGQRRLALARADAGRQRQTLELARTLAEKAEATRIDTLRSEARLASLQAAMPALEAAVARDLVALSVLAGAAPGQLPPDLATALQAHAGQPRARLAPDPGVPADLIRNRPDLALAEARYETARAALGRAQAALYPRLSLSGTIEISQEGGRGGTRIGAGPALRLPALPAGPARAGTQAAAREVEAAHADWTARVLAALAEVENALIDHRAAARTEAAADRAVRLHAEAQGLMRKAAALGEATLSDLIAAETALAEAEAAQADARLARAQAFVRLNLRLGSGAGPAAQTPPGRPAPPPEPPPAP